MKFDVIDFKYLKKLLFENKIVVTIILVICILIGSFFSFRNSFIYVAKTTMIFGRIKPAEQIVSNIVQSNLSEELGAENPEQAPESVGEENNEEQIMSNDAKSPEQNVSLTNVNIDSNTLKTCQTLIKSDNLIAKVKEKTQIEDSAKKIRKSITISKLQNSNVLLIIVKGSNANKACDLANGMAQVFSEEVKSIYNLDNVYIIDSIDYNDVDRTGFNPGFLILWLIIGILLSCLFIALKQFNVVNVTLAKVKKFFSIKIHAIKRFIENKFHKVEIRELPSGEELDENYKVVGNKSIVDSDFVPSDQPKIDNLISTNIEEFNSKTELFDDSVANIPMSEEAESKKADTSNTIDDNKKEEILKKIKSKKNDEKASVEKEEEAVEKKPIKKIGKEEAMSIKAQEELIALREENNQKMREERNRIDSQVQIQKRLNDEIDARKKLEAELESQKKSLQEERKAIEAKIRKEIQKQLLEEQRIIQEEEEKLALEIEMREQEEEQRIMEEERLKMLREKEERKERLRQERMEKRIIKDEMRKQRAEERAKQRVIASEERARRQAIKREEKIKLHNQREAERQEILRKYYEEKNNKVNNSTNEPIMYNEPKEEIKYNATIEENNNNNYMSLEHVKEKPIKRKELSEDFIQDNLYPKFKL